MSRRTFKAVRLGPELADIQTLADQETDGNLSEMIRRLLLEALAARTGTPPRHSVAGQDLS